MEAPGTEDAGGARGTAADHGEGCLGPQRRPGPHDTPGNGREWWGLQLATRAPQSAGRAPGLNLTPSAAEARSQRPRTHMVMATFTSCTSSSRRREPKKLYNANLAAE